MFGNDIAKKFKITRTRVYQILRNPPKYPKYIPPPKKNIFDGLGFVSLIKIDPKLGGRERTREFVRQRDNHTCQSCKKVWVEGMRRFDVHHLNGLCGKMSRSYDRMDTTYNLITLCHKCHFNHPEHSRNKA